MHSVWGASLSLYMCVGVDVGSLNSNNLTLKIVACQIVTGDL